MSIAVERNATRLWILNVGDLKPYERETEFFLTYGWNSSIWSPDNLNTFVDSWAQREFDLSNENAAAVTEIVANLTRWNARRKPELLNATTFSLYSYREYALVLLTTPTVHRLISEQSRKRGSRMVYSSECVYKDIQQPFNGHETCVLPAYSPPGLR